jgi:hypothetical protein
MAAFDKKPRLKLPVRRRPYFAEIRKGLAIGYRRNQGPGTWIVRGADGKGKNWMKAFATADDFEPANGETIMTYDQARDTLRAVVAGRAAGDPIVHEIARLSDRFPSRTLLS